MNLPSLCAHCVRVRGSSRRDFANSSLDYAHLRCGCCCTKKPPYTSSSNFCGYQHVAREEGRSSPMLQMFEYQFSQSRPSLLRWAEETGFSGGVFFSGLGPTRLQSRSSFPNGRKPNAYMEPCQCSVRKSRRRGWKRHITSCKVCHVANLEQVFTASRVSRGGCSRAARWRTK